VKRLFALFLLCLVQPVLSDTNQFRVKSDVEGGVSKSSELDVVDAVGFALSKHPRLLHAVGLEQSAKEMIDVAKSQYYPQVGGGLTSGYDRYRTGRFHKKYLQAMEINAEQMIYDFGKTAGNVKKAEFVTLRANAQTKLITENLINEVIRAVIEAARHEQLLILAKDFERQISDLTSLVQHRYEKGASTLSDVLQAKSRKELAKTLEIELESQRKQWLQQLILLTHLPTIEAVSLSGFPITLKDSCIIEDFDWEQSPEVIVADMGVEEAAAEMEIAKANEWPTLSIKADATRPLNATPSYGSRIDGRVQLNFNMPFYQGGGLSARKRAAASALQAAKAQAQEVRLKVQQYFTDLMNQYRSIDLNAPIYAERVKNISGTKGLYKKQYLDLGARTMVDLLNAEQEFHQAQVDVVNTEFDKKALQTECAYTKGLLAAQFNLGVIN
jgi:adhesin transport system outer membrane protein